MSSALTLLREEVFENFETILPEALPAMRARLSPGSLHGILFVEDFDHPAPPPAPEPPAAEPEIIAPSFSETDIEAAHEAGRELGLQAALAEHNAVQAGLSAAALAAIGDMLAATRNDAAAVAQRVAEDLACAVLALLQAALPAAAEASAGHELDALLRVLLPALTREPEVRIALHPELVDSISQSLAGLQPQFGDRLHVAAEPGLAKPDVTVTWRDGEAKRDWEALWRDLCEILAPYALPDIAAIMKGACHGQ
jgi:flagellar biosynthesis/type III secretory pathway protein FliH